MRHDSSDIMGISDGRREEEITKIDHAPLIIQDRHQEEYVPQVLALLTVVAICRSE